MENNSKLQIYKGIIQYLLGSTNYTLKNIAELCNSSIKSIQTIYSDSLIPHNFSSEKELVKLYQMILEINSNRDAYRKYLPLPKEHRQLSIN
ncbi:hypothetical protein Lspi_1230 [Legionella spiritensis]|uniref:Uncharacterized protein n=1 Tax=Legionella spiritensis TaxID=452 RepID=A0A0W0Z5I2_LEGSP|nr:hypothetical protein Lspi_1230 [Legionella spiritensis]SNV45953.1 Uncharacterised protein [Legionella spiritensis]